MFTPMLADHQTYIHQLCVDTKCYLEDLRKAMIDRDRLQENVIEIHAIKMTMNIGDENFEEEHDFLRIEYGIN